LNPDQAETLKAEQSRWLKTRDGLCGLAPEKVDEWSLNCLARLIDDRVKALDAASIEPVWRNAASDPEAALKKLQPLEGPLARVYAALLTHALAKDESFEDFDHFTTNLAELMGNNSSFWQQGPHPRVEIPCALVENHPRLLLATLPYFGNAMDTELPDLDCDGNTSMPRPPGVDSFLTKNPFTYRAISNSCTEKDGSYFVAEGYYRSLLEFRLVRFPNSYLSAGFGRLGDPREPWPTDQAIGAADWSGTPGYAETQKALAAFYVQQFKLEPADATTAAARALWDNRFPGDPDSGCEGL
jgi:hypothetical protein